jgi:hypothetical protein
MPRSDESEQPHEFKTEENLEGSLIDQFLSPWILVLFLSVALVLILGLWGCIFLTMVPSLRLNRIPLGLFCEWLLWAIIALLLANNTGYGDLYEVNRKTVVWPYFAIVVCTSALASAHFRQIQTNFRYRKAVWISLFLLLFCFSVFSSRNVQSRPGTEIFRNKLIEKGLFSSAIYIRRHSTSGEVVQLCENDPYLQLGVLAERPTYIMHGGVNNPTYSALENERFADVTNILGAQSHIAAKAQLARANIAWFLITPRCAAQWEVQATPVFSADGYRLYHPPSR